MRAGLRKATKASSTDPVAQTAVFAVCGFSFAMRVVYVLSGTGSGIGGHPRSVDGQAAAPLLLCRAHAGVFVEAGPFPILWAGDQPGPHRVHVDVFALLVVFLHGAQGAVEAILSF